MILIKSDAEAARQRKAGRMVAETLAALKDMVRPGVTTRQLEAKADELIAKAGGVPSFKGYRGYPASICASVNEQVVHGIPSGRRLNEGDIVSIDLGVMYEDYHGDAAITVAVGQVDPEVRRLMDVTEESLRLAIAEAVEGRRVSDIGSAVQRHVEAAGFSVVRSFVGHGIGKSLHEDPQVPNYGPPGRGARLKRGMALAIEPMVNAGTFEVRVLDDGWTAVTLDGRYSAHFEHTVLVGQDRAEVLTELDK